jgi:hypothetical protein
MTLKLVVVKIYLLYGNIQYQSFAIEKEALHMQSLLERAIPCRNFIEHVLGTVASSCWGAPYHSVWRGKEHRGVRMLRGTVIAGIFSCGSDACLLPHDGSMVAMLAFFLTTGRR